MNDQKQSDQTQELKEAFRLPHISEMPEVKAQDLARQAIQEERKRQKDAVLKRAQVMLLCEQSAEEMAVELYMCKESFFYFLEEWCWIEEPRSEIKRIPFLAYDYQRAAAELVLKLAASTVDTIEKHDILVEKTRDMGWSWLMCALATWLFLFHDKNILFGSRVGDLADKLGDMKSLLEKCRYILRNLPSWFFHEDFNMKPSGGHMGEGLIRKPSTWGTGTIAAESANPDFGRGDRKYIIILDEFASWAYDNASAQGCGSATSVRIFISTPNGPFNKFARMRNSDPSETIRPVIIRSHWLDHPIKRAGAAIGYDNKVTSPYYREEQKLKTADEMAAEIDICYEASTKGRVFEDYIPQMHERRGLQPTDRMPIQRIWDPGMYMYVLFAQVDKYNRVLALREVYSEDTHIRDIAEEVLYTSNKFFPNATFEDYGDSQGHTRQQASADRADYETLYDEYAISIDSEFIAHMPSHLRIPNRIQAIHNKLGQWIVATKSHGLLIDPEGCPILAKAMAEGYRYKVDKYTKKVTEKPMHEHPYCEAVDCLGYGVLAKLGSATKEQGNVRRIEIQTKTTNWSVWAGRNRSAG